MKTIKDILQAKREGKKITMLTAFDYLTASLIDEADIDIILVGDSLAMVGLGYKTTLPVTMQEMLHHTKAVVRGTKNALVVGDMPFMSYQVNEDEAVKNAGLFLKEAGAAAVKLEGAGSSVKLTKRLTSIGIPVMGHLGLTPQSINQLGGYDVQAANEEMAKALMENAKALEDAGAFSLVLEKIPADLGKKVSKMLSIPTIGIGAGADCDGQVLVTQDLLGLFTKFKPKFVKRYGELGKLMKEAFSKYRQEVEKGKFPDKEHSY
ncbi:MAG: 3-methyl-2-oxobutanoate hydroxymethyltransferase [Actinobacteria bacterium]|nr:MAG: 3-methyl-2-oxobutanoate hydroxymethyltransferase [Actinomycetota bacterium]